MVESALLTEKAPFQLALKTSQIWRHSADTRDDIIPLPSRVFLTFSDENWDHQLRKTIKRAGVDVFSCTPPECHVPSAPFNLRNSRNLNLLGFCRSVRSMTDVTWNPSQCEQRYSSASRLCNFSNEPNDHPFCSKGSYASNLPACVRMNIGASSGDSIMILVHIYSFTMVLNLIISPHVSKCHRLTSLLISSTECVRNLQMSYNVLRAPQSLMFL